jgi:hypothetical protein
MAPRFLGKYFFLIHISPVKTLPMYGILKNASRRIILEKKSDHQSIGVANQKPNPLMFKKKPGVGGTPFRSDVYKSYEGPRVSHSHAYGSPANGNPLSRGPEIHSGVIYRSPVNREINLSRIVESDSVRRPEASILRGKNNASVSNGG